VTFRNFTCRRWVIGDVELNRVTRQKRHASCVEEGVGFLPTASAYQPVLLSRAVISLSRAPQTAITHSPSVQLVFQKLLIGCAGFLVVILLIAAAGLRCNGNRLQPITIQLQRF
jgi:hypothetical protein